MKNDAVVFTQQKPLINQYLKDTKAAWITDVAVVEGKNLEDPFHTSVAINEELNIPFPVGVHRALGGLHDAPNPGDILCAALASCFESTLRMIANRLDIVLVKTKVVVKAEVDVRGSLMIDREVPVGFQKMSVDVDLALDHLSHPSLGKKLIKATEHCCIVFQTLRRGTPIEVRVNLL